MMIPVMIVIFTERKSLENLALTKLIPQNVRHIVLMSMVFPTSVFVHWVIKCNTIKILPSQKCKVQPESIDIYINTSLTVFKLMHQLFLPTMCEMEEDTIGGLQDPKVWRCTEIHVPATYHAHAEMQNTFFCRNKYYFAIIELSANDSLVAAIPVFITRLLRSTIEA